MFRHNNKYLYTLIFCLFLITTIFAEPSALEQKAQLKEDATNNPLSLILYRPTYIMPFYYTGSTDAGIYQGNTPNGQVVKNSEFKGQLSFLVPLINHVFSPNDSINIAYTQLSYWQVYAKSQYFRETNYEPEAFYEYHLPTDWLFRIGINHQSNGRGGDLERSWNRAIATAQYSQANWLAGVNVWSLIFTSESSTLHNPDIAHYLGHENFLFAYRFQKLTSAVIVQNIESGFKRGHQEITFSYPITRRIALYTQLFNGYGQSLIEYNHKTKSVGIGFAFNDWLAPSADSLVLHRTP